MSNLITKTYLKAYQNLKPIGTFCSNVYSNYRKQYSLTQQFTTIKKFRKHPNSHTYNLFTTEHLFHQGENHMTMTVTTQKVNNLTFWLRLHKKRKYQMFSYSFFYLNKLYSTKLNYLYRRVTFYNVFHIHKLQYQFLFITNIVGS